MRTIPVLYTPAAGMLTFLLAKPAAVRVSPFLSQISLLPSHFGYEVGRDFDFGHETAGEVFCSVELANEAGFVHFGGATGVNC